MKDCKHKYFVCECAVCWVKLSQGIKIKDAPVNRIDIDTEKYRQRCLDIARIVAEARLRNYI